MFSSTTSTRIASTTSSANQGDFKKKEVSMEGEGELTELHTSKKINDAQLQTRSSPNHCHWTATQIQLNESNPIARQQRQKEKAEEKESDDHIVVEDTALGTERVSATLTESLPLETLPPHLLTKSADSLDADFVYVTYCL